MAQKMTVELHDDLDGGPADETVRFGVDGAEREIDLSTKNAAALRRKLAPFIEHSRTAGRGGRHRGGRAASSRDRGGDIGAWAKDQGITVSERGRIEARSAEVATTGNVRRPISRSARSALPVAIGAPPAGSGDSRQWSSPGTRSSPGARSDPRVKVLTQLPGVGPFTALVILAEIGDVSRFGSARKLAS